MIHRISSQLEMRVLLDAVGRDALEGGVVKKIIQCNRSFDCINIFTLKEKIDLNVLF